MSEELLIEKGLVMTMNPVRKILENGSIAVAGEKIIDLGSSEELRKKYPHPKKVIDAKNKLVMPGLINTHIHLIGFPVMKGIRPGNYGYGNPYLQRLYTILDNDYWNEEVYYLSGLLNCIEMIKSGTTSAVDCGTSVGSEEMAVKLITESGMRAVLALETMDIFDKPGYYIAERRRKRFGSTQENIDRTQKLIDKYHGAAGGRIYIWTSVMQVMNSSDDLIKGLKRLRDKYRVGMTIHANVMRPMTEVVEKAWGKPDTERLGEVGVLGPDCLLAHACDLNGLKHRLLNETPRQELELGLRYTLKSMRRTGTTFFSDFREGGLEGVALLEKVAKAEQFCCQILGRPFGSETEASILSEPKAHGLGLATLDDVSPDVLQRIQKLNTRKKMIAWHLSERSREPKLLALTEQYPPSFIVHGTHLTMADIERLGEKNVGIVFCPRSNVGLGVGIPPLLEALQRNSKIALGTDNVMAVDPDLFRELEFAYRLINLKPEARKIPPKFLLELVTTRSARVLGVEQDRGSLVEGKFADFFLVDLRAPNLHCKSRDFIKCLINRVKSENVYQVYQEGIKVLDKYEDSKDR